MPKQTFENLPDEKRRRLVDFAIDEFAEHPFAQASLSRIVARAGIAKGSIYQYFDDKLDLYRWLLTHEVARLKQEHLAAAVPPASGDLFDRLGAMYLAGLRFLLSHPRIARLGARAMEPSGDPGADQVHTELRRMGLDGMRALLVDARSAGELAPGVDIDLAAHVIAQVMGPGLTNALLERIGTDLEGLLNDPRLALRIGETELKALAQGAAGMLRRGIGGGDAGGPSNSSKQAKGAKR
ncbi:MAG: TetR/AcrR family transcriptional regulator [Polyangiaceae bacterium]|nr:TetR/AcrR family transcriptional regulator [Polyangiaceae bacterium]